MNGRPGPVPLLVLLVLVLLDTLVLGFFGLTPAGYLSHDTPKEIFLLLGAAALLGERLVRSLRRREAIETAPVDGGTTALLIFVLLLAVGALRAHDPSLAARRLGVLVAGVALLLEARARIRGPRALFGTLTAIGGVIAAYGVVQVLGWEPLGFDNQGEALSTLGNRTWAASLLALLIPVGAAATWSARGRTRMLAAGALLLMLAHLGLSRGRAGWVGLAVAVLVGAALAARPKIRVALVSLAVLVAAGLVTFTLSVGPDLSSPVPIPGRLDTIRVRGLIWRGTADLVAERPVLGHGLTDFVAEYERVRPDEEFRLSLHREVGTPHDTILELSAETGVPSALVFLAALVLIFRSALRRSAADGPTPFRIAGLAGALGLLVAGLFASPLSHPGHVAALFVLLGATVGPATGEGRRWPVTGLLAAQTVAAAFLLAAGVFSFRELQCERAFVQSRRVVGGRMAFSASTLADAVTWSSRNVAARLTLGRVARDSGRIPAARENFEAILDVRPWHVDVRYLLAHLDEREGKTTEAESRLRDALSLQPASPAARLNLADFLERENRSDEALAEHEAVLRVLGLAGPHRPAEVQLRRLRARETKCLEIAVGALARFQDLGSKAGRTDDVLAALRGAESWYPHPDRPDPPASRLRAATVLARAGRTGEAVDVIKEVVPALLAAERQHDARQGIAYVVTGATPLAPALIRLAERWAGEGAFDAAETLLAGVVRAEAASGDAWTALERIARRRGDEVRARSYLVRARLAFAREAALEGDLDGATRHLRVAQSRGATESAALYVRALLSVKMGREHHGAALRHLEAAAEAGYADLERLELDARDALAPIANPRSPNWQRVLNHVRVNASR